MNKKKVLLVAIYLFLLCVVPLNVYAITYYVRFNNNGGSGTMSNQTFTTDEEKYLTTNTFTKAGYDFIGWNSNSSGTGTWYMPSKKVKNLSNTNGAIVDIYAQWMESNQGSITTGGSQFPKDTVGNYSYENYKKFTVNVTVSHGTVNTASKTVEYYTNATFNLTPATGYANPTVSCTNSQNASITNNVLTVSSISNNTTCIVTFVEQTYTVKYYNKYLAPSDYNLTLSSTGDYPWTNEGTYWKSGNYNIASSTSVLTSEEFVLTDSKLLEFDWSVSSQGTSYDYLYYTITKNGATLSGTGTSTKIGGTSMGTSLDNLTYANVKKVLEAGTYTISFTYTKNASTDTGLDSGFVKNLKVVDYGTTQVNENTMANSIHTLDIAKNLNPNTYTRTGYTFLGWTKTDGGTTATYDDEEQVTNLSNSANTTVNLYAVWEINSYTVTVKSNSGSFSATTGWTINGDTATKSFNYRTPYGTFPTISRTGYTFDGWYTSADGGTKVESEDFVTGNITLFAHWTPIKYKIQTSNGSSVTQSNWHAYKEISTTSCRSSYSAYRYCCSYSRSGGGTTSISYKSTSATRSYNGVNCSSSSHTCTSGNSYSTRYVQSTSKNCKTSSSATSYNGYRLVTYKSAIVTCSTASNCFVELDYDSEYGTLPEATKTGYTFDGWWTSSSGGTEVTSSKVVTGNATIYAHWTANPYTVTADANGGTLTETAGWTIFNSMTPTYGGSLSGDLETQLDTTALSNAVEGFRTQYSENIPSSLTGKKLIIIGDRDGVPNYAIEQVLQSTGADIVYSHNDAFIYTGAEAVDLDIQQNIADTVDDYGVENIVVILGSSDAEAAEIYAETVTLGDPTYAGPLAGVSLNLPVYHVFETFVKSQANSSQWTQYINNATPRADSMNDGSTGIKEVVYDQTYGTLPTPIREGYIFLGWYTTPTGTTQKTSSSLVLTASDHTLYAQWVKDVTTYASTGEYETFTAEATGKYKIELWGAQGGTYNSSIIGGKGAYTSGIIELTRGDNLYVYVGGQPTVVSSANYSAGGYNGGGNSGYNATTDYSRGGGGSTDVRTTSGTWNDETSLNSRIMVAAAGGGSVYGGNATYSLSGAPGGMLKGIAGVSSYPAAAPNGGTQTSYGTGYHTQSDRIAGFGFGGGTQTVGTNTGWGGGGGSGYYGGALGFGFPGASGSSYISGYQGSVAITASDDRTAKCTEAAAISDLTCSNHYSNRTFTNPIMIAGDMAMPSHDGESSIVGNPGDGYAKITYIIPECTSCKTLTYDFNVFNNMEMWDYNGKSQFTTTYDSSTKMNNISVSGTNNTWEMVYMPITTIPGKDYKITFDYINTTDFSVAYGNGGVPVQALNSISNSNNYANSAKTQFLLSPIANESTQNLTFEFTARSSTTYLAFNFGWVTDGTTANVQLGNFKIVQSKNSGAVLSDLPTLTPVNGQFNGYFTTATAGTKITTSSTMPSSNTTYYAQGAIKEKTYSYSGQPQTFTAPEAGKYKIELWGASGGEYPSYLYAGEGAYTSGIVELVKNEQLYVYVGGVGKNTNSYYNLGGYNGGGASGNYTSGGLYTAGGGGATDVRTVGGAWNDSEGLNSRIMVAGGGAGTGTYTGYLIPGGYGGALTGGSGTSSSASYQPTTGGTQVSGGTNSHLGTAANGYFGYANQTYVSTGYGSGAGGGYWGGAEGYGSGGSGGSSYVSGYQGSVGITSSSDITAKCTQNAALGSVSCSNHYSGKVFENPTMQAGDMLMPTHDGSSDMTGNSGDGYAKITYLGPTCTSCKTLTYDFNTVNNMNLWDLTFPEVFNITYNSSTKMNSISMSGVSGWEIIYLPITTVPGKDYKVTFDYLASSGYTASTAYPGIGVQALKNSPSNSNNYSNAVKTHYLLSPVANASTQNLTFEFTASGTTTYLAFNFGMLNDSIATSIQLGNFKIVQSKDPGDTLNDMPIFELSSSDFAGYYTATSGGTQIENTDTMPNANTTYYAQTAAEYTVTINPNGGTLSGKTTSYTISRNEGKKIEIPKPTKTGLTFKGWSKTGPGSLSKYGSGLYNDDAFASSNNSMTVYNNNANGVVTHAKIATTSDNPIKNSSYIIQITTNGSATPGLGGFYQNTQSRANAVFYHVIVAKIPKGYKIERAANATGDGTNIEWLTSQEGTGRYETYIYRHTCGSSGTFSTFGHVYLQANSGYSQTVVTWYVAYANIFDYTASPSAEDGQVFIFGEGNTTLTAIWDCESLPSGTYTAGQTVNYGGRSYTVLSDNGSNVTLALNGTYGSGNYSNANTYLTSNFVGGDSILNAGKDNGCLVSQGTGVYATTNSGSSSANKPGSTHWIGSGSVYEPSTIYSYAVSSGYYGYGWATSSNNLSGALYNTGVTSTVQYNAGTVFSVAVGDSTITYYNGTYYSTGSTGYVSDWISRFYLNKDKCSSPSSKKIAAYRSDNHLTAGGGGEYSYCTTKKIVAIVCGGSYHGGSGSWTAKSSTTYSHTNPSGYTDNTAYYSSDNSWPYAGTAASTTSGTANSNLVRTFNFVTGGYCASRPIYAVTNWVRDISYRPVIKVVER